MAGETSPNSTTGLDDFALGEGISPGGNEELLDSLVDIADDNSPRGPGLAPPHTVTSDAMDLSDRLPSLEVRNSYRALSTRSTRYERRSSSATRLHWRRARRCRRV